MVWLRLGGRGTDASGATVLWSVAQGTRGTRWREAGGRDGQVARSLLLELTPTDGVARLELSTAAGLLTLHPGSDGTMLHGNVVSANGIRHLGLPWGRAHQVLVMSSPIALAALVRGLDAARLVGEEVSLDVVRVDDGLDPAPDIWTVTANDLGTWSLCSIETGQRLEVRLDPVGLPLLQDAEIWPLER